MLKLPQILYGKEQENNKEEKKGGRNERKYEIAKKKKVTYFATLDILICLFLAELIIQACTQNVLSTYDTPGIVCDAWYISVIQTDDSVRCASLRK